MKRNKWIICSILVVGLLAYFFTRPSVEELNSASENKAFELIDLLEAHKLINGEYPESLTKLEGTTEDYSKYDPVPILYSKEYGGFKLSYQQLPLGPFRDYDRASSSWTFSE